jgi:hypothetical protein
LNATPRRLSTDTLCRTTTHRRDHARFAAEEDAGVRDDVVLTDPWWDLRNSGEPEQQEIQAVTKELLREMSPGCALHGAAFVVIGRSQAREDVLLKAVDRRALASDRGWKPEPPPWPTCVFFDSARDVEQALAYE